MKQPTYVYRVQLCDYYILRLDSSITAARSWAHKAFPKSNATIRRDHYAIVFCGECDAYPCVCDEIVGAA
jgi:hypothetical protein